MDVHCCLNRFCIATTPSLQDGIAKELSEAQLLAHGQDREPRPISFDDIAKLPYLQAVCHSLSAFVLGGCLAISRI